MGSKFLDLTAAHLRLQPLTAPPRQMTTLVYVVVCRLAVSSNPY